MPKLNTTTSGIITATLTADSSPTLELQQNGVAIRTLGESQLVMGTSQSTATGAVAYDFTGIPSWAKRITVMFDGVSKSGTSNFLVQLGDSGGIENTGYIGNAIGTFTGPTIININSTAGFPTAGDASAASVIYGAITFNLIDASTNNWVAAGVIALGNAGYNTTIAGRKALSGTLDRVRVTTVNGTDTFDAGTVNIMWE